MKNADEIREDAIPVSAEDRFIVFSFGSGSHLCPVANNANHLGEMIFNLRSPFDTLTPVFDLRGVEGYYNDIDTFIRSVGGDNSHVLLGDAEVDGGWDEMLRRQGLQPLRMRGQSFTTEYLDLHLFDCETDLYHDGVLASAQYEMTEAEYAALSYDDIETMGDDEQLNDLHHFLTSIHQNSLLVEFTMSFARDKIEIVPYHAHAVHEIETAHESVILSRPGVIAHATRAVFSSQISEFEQLINDPNTKEHNLQTFLEQHPQFLRGLNYQNIYSQLVLERDNDGSLRPDFILEPFDDAFCDILDIKLPTQRLVVGRKDRATLAAGLHEVAAQLREYAAYFDQPKYQRFVRDTYGLRIYRPRLIAIVGRDMKQMNDDQLRRAMTEYQNLQFMTFDELLTHARNRMLI